jgi:two-component system, response regulator PdtaR
MVVLIVEDEAIIAYCSAAILEGAGLTVLGPAHTTVEALELARNCRPDVALVDIDLERPGAGIGLARQLRTQFATAIVFTTGRADLACAHHDTAVAVLSKPYDPSELPGVVRYADSRPRAAGSRATPSRSVSVTRLPAHNGSGA